MLRRRKGDVKGGAIEFLTEPFQDQDLLDAVQLGLAHDNCTS